jgi:ubiquinone/menaquinone biosynthesis C-methylase UbiE
MASKESPMTFLNVYEDVARAKAYAKLEFPGTYYLAFRDLPEIIAKHVRGNEALDFGCGAGRSTRFLKKLGFETVGIDISSSMIEQAKNADPGGAYRLVGEGDLCESETARFDLILCAFPFDNIPGVENRVRILDELGRLLRKEGRVVMLGSTPEIYVNEWASFTTKDFAQNRLAKSGDAVLTVMKDVADARPVVDVLWSHEDYLRLFKGAGLELIAESRPLGRSDEPYPWVSETRVAPWVIYVLGI